jgi:DNA polymerase III alpha subunit
MNYDKFGQAYCSESELCDIIYKNPNQDIAQFLVEDPTGYNTSVKRYYNEFPLLNQYEPFDINVDDFDDLCQSQWNIPDEYKQLDIVKWLVDKCDNEDKLQRVAHELLQYQEKGLIPLLQFLKYLVDIMLEHNIVWGVGRGSSVSSYVLFLIGVHSVDSLYYDLDVGEFLR